jgi:hypothetical protein
MRFRDITGLRFGKRIVLSCLGRQLDSCGRVFWHWQVRCDCGRIDNIIAGNLVKGRAQSCRLCAQKKSQAAATLASVTHGHSGGRRPSATYTSWASMKARCKNSNLKDYPRYGGRGITVCRRWRGKHGFENFLSDMGPRPKGKSCDRRRVNGNYNPSNCHWATASEQIANQRKRLRLDQFSTASLAKELRKRGVTVLLPAKGR